MPEPSPDSGTANALNVAAHRGAPPAGRWPVLAVISLGGVVGALARYGIQSAYPHHPGGFAWATFGVNVSGCLLIGVFMMLVTEVWPRQRLLRPFVGVDCSADSPHSPRTLSTSSRPPMLGPPEPLCST